MNRSFFCPGHGLLRCMAALLCLIGAPLLHAEDGHELWLRYAALDTAQAARVTALAGSIVLEAPDTPTTRLAIAELQRGLAGLLDRQVPQASTARAGSIVLLDTASRNSFELAYADLGEEGFRLQRVTHEGATLTVIAANSDRGLLYGAFELLRQFQTNPYLADLDLRSVPRIDHRLLNHWDNLDRTVERGYAGFSIWDWWRLPDYADPRYTEYARANASLGINGTVINNVNSNALILTPEWLDKVAAIADVLRPWGIRVYLSARFSAPQEIGGLPGSDPLDPSVQQWWQDKADEIYARIPDFGGFLVKANSEGQPGPQDFGRSHADGANMLARAVAPHGGIVMWRAFVYSEVNPEDRHKQAYSEFKPLDGQFEANVIVQVKNGAIDFQPREPFHPMFGAFPATPLMMEFQITKEYLGFATHLVWLGPLFEEVLQADTHARGPGSLVAEAIDGSLHGHTLSAIAGVSGIGSDRDWQGSDFNQANWYAYGRLAWNPYRDSDSIAREWLAQTFSRDAAFIDATLLLMNLSREAVVDYMTPLGLGHLMGTGHHYGPAPWVAELGRPEWNPVYYHRADREGIGFDRTASGSDALSQYFPGAAANFSNPATMDERFLLWFHRVPWEHRMQDGSTLWEALVRHYDRGVESVKAMQALWEQMAPYVDGERFTKAQTFLEIQLREAQWWRDACLAYFMDVSGRALPAGVRAPEYSLEYYKSLVFPHAPG